MFILGALNPATPLLKPPKDVAGDWLLAVPLCFFRLFFEKRERERERERGKGENATTFI